MTTINVTQHHIDMGDCRNCWLCPVALAVAEVIAPRFAVQVGWSYAAVYHDGILLWGGGLPEEAQQFIVKFDDFDMPKPGPITFDIDIPERFLRTSEAPANA